MQAGRQTCRLTFQGTFYITPKNKKNLWSKKFKSVIQWYVHIPCWCHTIMPTYLTTLHHHHHHDHCKELSTTMLAILFYILPFYPKAKNIQFSENIIYPQAILPHSFTFSFFFFAFLFGCLVLPIRPTDRALPTIFTRFTRVQPTNMYLYLPFTTRYFEFSIWEEKVQGTQQDLLSSFTTIIIIGPLFCMADPRDDDDNDVAVCVVCKHQVQISCIPHHTK